jgi:peptidoglycan/LPS O-acetylase OafA/YrhL
MSEIQAKALNERAGAGNPHMPALTGVRFFAILHIYCFHLWAIYSLEKPAQFKTLLVDMGDLPRVIQTFLANGWMSTSFFFLLSGFILAYIYWGPDGELTLTKKIFWWLRLTRIYPIHLILLLITIPLTASYAMSQGVTIPGLITSGLATAALVQSWYPDWVPVWSWPTWTISALVFLYALMPFLMPKLARLTHRNSVVLLCALPFISLIPTCIYSVYFPPGAKPDQFWQIFIGSTPIFWLAHFVAGMLLTRVCSLSKFNQDAYTGTKRFISFGDLALLVAIAIGCIPGIEEPFKYFLRHGLMMPLYMVVIVDLARGNGLAARLFSFRWMGFLGGTGFSIFIWQNMVMIICWIAVTINPAFGAHQFIWAMIGMVLLGILSAYGIEKPIAKRLRRKFTKA